MVVSDLISELERYSPDLEVELLDDYDRSFPLRSVRLAEEGRIVQLGIEP